MFLHFQWFHFYAILIWTVPLIRTQLHGWLAMTWHFCWRNKEQTTVGCITASVFWFFANIFRFCGKIWQTETNIRYIYKIQEKHSLKTDGWRRKHSSVHNFYCFNSHWKLIILRMRTFLYIFTSQFYSFAYMVLVYIFYSPILLY
jgi:hypothetical protein